MVNRNDIQSAVKRNLHNWTDWRIDMNRRLLDSMTSGQPVTEGAPLASYLAANSRNAHAVEHPRTLLTYSAAHNSATQMDQEMFLHYGIPRVKVMRYQSLDNRLDNSLNNRLDHSLSNRLNRTR